MRSVVVAALVWACASSAIAQGPPLEFKGLPLGASEAQWRSAFPFFTCGGADSAAEVVCEFDADANRRNIGPDCAPQVRTDADRTCIESAAQAYNDFIAFGGAHITTAKATFQRGRLVAVTARFASPDVSALTTALSVKYGAPKIETRAMTNGFGAKFENVIATWTAKGGQIQTRRYADTRDEGIFAIATDGYVQDVARRRMETAKGNARTL